MTLGPQFGQAIPILSRYCLSGYATEQTHSYLHLPTSLSGTGHLKPQFHGVQKALSVVSEAAVLVTNWCSHWQKLPQRSMVDASFMWTPFPILVQNGIFTSMRSRHECIQLPLFCRRKAWNKTSHLIDEATEKDFSHSVTSNKIFSSPNLHHTLTFYVQYFTKRVKEWLELSQNSLNFRPV